MRKIFLCLLIIVTLSVTGCSVNNIKAQNIEEYTKFTCDIENDNIRVSEEEKYFGKFDLETMKFYDKDEMVIAYVDDSYNFVTQNDNSYGIYIEDEFKYDFVEIKDVFGGKTYEIFNEKSEYLANVINEKKNIIKIKDANEELVADCQITDANQYFIKIYKYNIYKEAIVMIINIYYNNIIIDNFKTQF